MPNLKTLQDRFWEKVDKECSNIFYRGTRCWEWTASLSRGRSGGYGEMRNGLKIDKAHRLSWVFAFGEIPDNVLVCHKCDNRKCVNPEHLFLGTIQDNNLDRDRKGRASTTHLQGEKHPLHKLTHEQVLEIQSSNLSQRALAKIYGIGQSHTQRIKSKQVWKHV